MSNMNQGGGEKSPPRSVFETADDRGYVTMKQFCVLFKRDYRTIRKWCAERRVHSIKVGGQYRIMEEEVRYVLENGTREPTHDANGNPLPESDNPNQHRSP
jgi:excisionase family DNA binding protein